MGAWHGTYANLLRSRYSALVAYAEALLETQTGARDLAQDASVAVFARRKSPRDTQSAEIAAREWMAAKALEDGAEPEHVATILIALDGKDEAGIKAILKKAAPDPLPDVPAEDVEAIRRLYAESAAVYATPTGGVNTIMDPARRRHQSALAGAAGGTVVAIAVVAVAGWFGLNHLPDLTSSAAAPTASASPSEAGYMVTWDPEPDFNAAVASFHFPQCGDEWDPPAQAVGGVTPKPTIGKIEEDSDNGQWVEVSDGFTSDDGEQTAVLAQPYSYVVTLDGVVIFTLEDGFYGMDLFNANSPGNGSGIGWSPSNTCEARAAQDALIPTLDGLSNEDQNKVWDKFYKEWNTFKPGTYKIYQVSPMVFGEQAALGQAFALEGVTGLSSLSQDISWSDLGQDPRITPFCAGSRDNGDYQCTVPHDVLEEVLTLPVDPETINDTQPGVGISEPLVYTVPDTVAAS